jgi:hypothetical protein
MAADAILAAAGSELPRYEMAAQRISRAYIANVGNGLWYITPRITIWLW